MARYPETQSLLEQALRHVLSEQGKLLLHPAVGELNNILQALNRLATETSSILAEGFNPSTSTTHLTKQAVKIESAVDNVSESLWMPIFVSVSAIYERVEKSFHREPGKLGFAADVRAHYHNLRISLLEQLIGARMLVLNSDLGDEVERIWQQFLERQLGPSFRVLRGGHICDHEGKSPPQQTDLIVVPADAHVFVPGNSVGGKATVLVDQVISAIEVTSNLTVEKLKQDWRKLQSLPNNDHLEQDLPNLKGHPWPLCFIVASNSDPAEELKKAWIDLCQEGLTRVVPQLVVALDTGYLYSGSRRWPCPQFPGNYVAAGDVNAETEIYAGLGLAWLIAQHQGRLALVKRQPTGMISRLSELLDAAMLRESTPPTHSRRFDTILRQPKIAGVFEWGRVNCFPHNKLNLSSLERRRDGVSSIYELELFQAGVDPKSLTWESMENFLRWFRYGNVQVCGKLLALEEWIAHKSKTEHRQRIAIFDIESGAELTGTDIDDLKVVADLVTLKRG